ncbi:MAG: DUF2878 domain-containing protein [Pseudomonadales bacterium]|nr:DUF2878 domain-containing protein [Pseudomonadales bacterium]
MSVSDRYAQGAASRTAHMLINAGLFQICWFLAVVLQSHWMWLVVVLMLAHALIYVTGNLRALRAVAFVAVLGIVLDTGLRWSGTYLFPGQELDIGAWMLPLWLYGLWLAFALTVPISLSWLAQRRVLWVVSCGVIGPLSYLAGRKLGAIDYPDVTIVVQAVQWAGLAWITQDFLDVTVRDNDSDTNSDVAQG